MKNISLEVTNENYLITIDRNLMDKESFYAFFERLRTEYLAKKMNTKENNLMLLSEEIKTNWWKKNESQLMEKIQNYTVSNK